MMAFQLSPGINVSEIDLTTIVPGVATSTGAFAGNFTWGPANEIMTVSDELQLVDMFGKPTQDTFTSFFSAANFLSYSNNLKLVRAVDTATAKNATANSSGALLIANQDQYEQSYYSFPGATGAGIAAARYPGALGNGLTISICADNSNFSSWPYKAEFNGAPGTSAKADLANGEDDELHLIVIDGQGKFSGTPGTVLEKFAYLSKASDSKTDDGSSNYYVNVINARSKYVYIMNHPATTTNWGGSISSSFDLAMATATLAGGVDGAPDDGDLTIAYDKFRNADEVDVSLIITGDASQTVSEYIADNIAKTRMDCIVFISPLRDDVVNNAGQEVTNITAYRNDFNSTSYAVMDNNWKYQFDKYNNVYRWVPINADIAGLCARTDNERDPWFSPAGLNRGQIKNVVKLAWNPTKANRDDLYKIGINSVVSFPGEGVVLYGDKTMLTKPSAFDRINVRRLFIVLEKAIARAARYSLFEFNDEFTRAQFVALVEPFLRDVKGRRGIYDFRVVCDESNNTPEVIDRNEFIGDIYIKPARSINFIQLNFIAVRTGVAFEEIVGRF
jgi:hypothetical protein